MDKLISNEEIYFSKTNLFYLNKTYQVQVLLTLGVDLIFLLSKAILSQFIKNKSQLSSFEQKNDPQLVCLKWILNFTPFYSHVFCFNNTVIKIIKSTFTGYLKITIVYYGTDR